MKTIKIKELELSLNDEQIKELQAQLAEPVNKRWKPEINKRYYFVDECNCTNFNYWNNDEIDNFRYLIGNVFKTEQEAKQALKTGWVAKLQAEQRIKDYILEKGYDTNVDWSDKSKHKFFICYNYEFQSIRIDWYSIVKTSNLPHFVNKSEAEDTMQHCEADYKLLLGVE